MAFGISKQQLQAWKESIDKGEIAFITHYWLDNRFPNAKTVTKVGCRDLNRLEEWGSQYGLLKEWIHHRKYGYSHFDLLGEKEKYILIKEGFQSIVDKFNL